MQENQLQDASVQYFKNLVRSNFTEVPGMLTLLKELRRAHIKTICLSDHCREWVEYSEQKFHFLDLFDYAFFSFQTGLSKRNPQAYLHLIEKSCVNPATTMLVDDRKTVIDIARASPVNIRYVHHFNCAEALLKDLKYHNLI
ncbi:MAG: HAD hydrolase-like protein [Candidatus Woesearchaeota archaeon]